MGFESWLYHLLAVQLGERKFTSLSLSFRLCKMGLTVSGCSTSLSMGASRVRYFCLLSARHWTIYVKWLFVVVFLFFISSNYNSLVKPSESFYSHFTDEETMC